jgi:MFS family permease
MDSSLDKSRTTQAQELLMPHDDDGVIGDGSSSGGGNQAKPAGLRRYLVMVMCFFGLMLVYMMRVDLSIAVLLMEEQFRWNLMPSDPKGFVLSSFYVGYIVGQVPGGMLATRHGGNIVFGIGVLTTGVLTLALPLATCGGPYCPAYVESAVDSNATNATCGYGSANVLATISKGNLTFDECYSACLGTCFQHGNASDVCGTNSKFDVQPCVSNCTMDSYCQVFAFGNDTSSGPTCTLYHACQASPLAAGLSSAAAAAAAAEDATDGNTAATTKLYLMQTDSLLPLLYAVRILMGVFESVTFPAFFALLSMWTPASERSFMVSATTAGSFLGTAVAFPVCSTLVTSSLPLIGHWPGMFYLFGLATIVWSVVWFAVVRRSPEDDPALSPAERHWIVSTRKDGPPDGHGGGGGVDDVDSAGELGHLAAVGGKESGSPDGGDDGAPRTCRQKLMGSIWTRILLCSSSWALFLSHAAGNYTNYTLLSFLPTYFSSQLKFDLNTAGGIEVIP